MNTQKEKALLRLRAHLRKRKQIAYEDAQKYRELGQDKAVEWAVGISFGLTQALEDIEIILKGLEVDWLCVEAEARLQE